MDPTLREVGGSRKGGIGGGGGVRGAVSGFKAHPKALPFRGAPLPDSLFSINRSSVLPLPFSAV